mgnify:CR=1 FL=1
MEHLTQAQRVMLHLYRYRYYDMDGFDDAPFDVTQDGISEALGISRSYSSLILGRMRRDGIVTSSRSMVINKTGRVSRQVYALTESGLRRCDSLIGERDADVLLPRTLNHCRTTDFDRLAEEDRDVLGSLILIRTPVESIRIAGRATQGVIVMRFKEEGDRVISLALADPEEKTDTEETV